MKSSEDKLKERGFLMELDYSDSENTAFSRKLELLNSKDPSERTLGARLLKNEDAERSVRILTDALKEETKLYTKIEISNALIHFGEASVKLLTDQLGRIGKNQHRKIPVKEFKKDNYPLPRDIAARILSKTGVCALPELIKKIKGDNIDQISEAIDAIGSICFYTYQTDYYTDIVLCFRKYSNNELIKWKIIRAMSAFPESKDFLTEHYRICKNDRIKKEIERSLRLLKNRN